MADSELTILIKARNEAKAEFDKLNTQVKGLQGQSGFGGLNSKLIDLDSKFRSVTGVSLGFASAAGLAGMAVKGLWNFLKSSVEETVTYATEVDKLSRLLGITTVETSQLVQASDDLFISQESLSTALLAATRKGIDVSVEGLKELSNQYMKLNPGVERGKFLMDNFGRSGAEMGKLMEKGAEGIQEAIDAIDNSLIITEQSYNSIMNYKRSVDNLTDSWQGFKYEVGNNVIPQLDLLFRLLTKGVDDTESFELAQGKLNNKIFEYDRGITSIFLSESKQLEKVTDLKRQLADLETAYYGASRGVEQLNTSVIPASAYMQELSKQLIFNQAAAGLDEQSILILAESMGLVKSNTAFALNALQGWRSELSAGVITLDEYKKRVANLTKEWEKLGLLGDVHLSATIDWNLGGGIGAAEKALNYDLNGNGIIGAEHGADFTVPPGYPHDSMLMGVSSGEHVSVTPAGKSSGGTTVILNYSPALSLSSKTEAETVLVPLIKRALSRAG